MASGILKPPKWNKKGDILSWFFVIVTLFAVAVSLLFMPLILDSFHDALTGTKAVTDAGGEAESALDAGKNVANMMDMVFLIIFAGYALSLIVTGMLIDTHPAFFFIFMILVVFGLVVSAPLSNAFNDIAEVDVIDVHASDHTMTNAILDNFPFAVLIIAFLTIVALFAKQRSGG